MTLNRQDVYWLESSFAEKIFKVLLETKLNTNQQNVLVAKANRLLDCISNSVISRRMMILSFYSAQVRSRMESSSWQYLASYYEI